MTPFNCLTELEKSNIVKYINYYAGGTEGTDMTRLPKVLSYWNNAKADLFKLFGNQLILSKHISYQRPQDATVSEMRNMWIYNDNSTYNIFRRTLRDMIRTAACYYNAMDLLNISTSLADNIYHGESFTISSPASCKTIKIDSGCKTIRALGKIAEAFGLVQQFENFRIEHSQILNQRETHGELCLSIHPLDFMTMSDNNSNWDSCMSWRNEGCYRSGTVEMMNSPIVIVAYLRAKEDMKLFYDEPEYKWNNKKWRCLYVVDPNVIASVKGYPYCNSNLDVIVINWLRELYAAQDVVNYDDPIAELPYEELSKRVEFGTDQMYNDFDSCAHTISYNTEFEKSGNRFYITYSGVNCCVVCGEIKDTYDEGILLCSDHDGTERFYCAHCGERIDGEVCWGHDECYCESCWDELFYCDDIDNDIHEREDSEWAYVLKKEQVERLANDHDAHFWRPLKRRTLIDRERYSGNDWFSRFTITNYRTAKTINHGTIRYFYPEDLTQNGEWVFGLRSYWSDERRTEALNECIC